MLDVLRPARGRHRKPSRIARVLASGDTGAVATVALAVLAVMAAVFLASLLGAAAAARPAPVAPVVIRGAHLLEPASPTTVVVEDDPRWNCLTMGNRRCGPDWTLAPRRVVRALGYPAGSLWRVGATTVVVSPDGRVTTS